MNKLYQELDMLRNTVNAQNDAMEKREALHRRFVRENVRVREAARKLLLAVLVEQSRSRLMPAMDMTEEIEAMRKALGNVD
jgi:hypothetical protein